MRRAHRATVGTGLRCGMEALHFDAVEAIYATAEGARDWSDALGMLCANVGAEGAWLGLHRGRGGVAAFASVVGSTAVVTALPESFVGRAGEQDRAQIAPDLLRPLGGFGIRRPWIEADDVTDDAHLIRLDLLRADGSTLVLLCARSAAAGPFQDGAQSVLEQLVQHVDRALRLSARLPDPVDQRLRELDLRGVPALILDRSRTVVAMNHAAEEFGEAMALPWQVDVPLELGACHRNAELTRILRASVGSAVHKHLLPLCGRHGDDGSALVVGPAPKDAPDYALASVARRDRPTHLCAEQLRELFDLTPTESRLAVMIASGCSPETAAERCSVSVGTVRWHLKRVFAKTCSAGQTELVAQLQALAYAI